MNNEDNDVEENLWIVKSARPTNKRRCWCYDCWCILVAWVCLQLITLGVVFYLVKQSPTGQTTVGDLPDVRVLRAQRHTQEDIEPLLFMQAAFSSFKHSDGGHTALWSIESQTSFRHGFIKLNDTDGEFQLKKTGYYEVNVQLYYRKANCLDNKENFLYFCITVNDGIIACAAMTNNDTNGSFSLPLTSPRSRLFSAGDKVKVVMNECGKCISTEAKMSNIELVYRRHN